MKPITERIDSMKIGNYHIKWQTNLKHWGENIQYCKTDTIIKYIRFYALFIFFGNPDIIRD